MESVDPAWATSHNAFLQMSSPLEPREPQPSLHFLSLSVYLQPCDQYIITAYWTKYNLVLPEFHSLELSVSLTNVLLVFLAAANTCATTDGAAAAGLPRVLFQTMKPHRN